ncbi:MAG TPA: aldolase/citrate lyase family protein [Azospirillaceae bacterium]|nr:aldolase/citrate lyase family protein [Azospirillaceae bacterium]
MFRENPVKHTLRAGHSVTGCWLALASPAAAEIVGLSGINFGLICNEHGPATLAESRAMIQALAATPAASFMRVPWNDAVYVKRALDLGIEGIMFPAINSAEEARAAVAACRYPPKGVRGYGMGLARAGDYGLAKPAYLDGIDDNLMIVCQIESVQAVEAIPDIAAVDGVDALFIGPYDLSAGVGKLGDFDDPAVRDLLARAERAILDSGRVYGTIPTQGRSQVDLLASGCRMVVAGSDVGFLRAGAQALVAAGRAAGRVVPGETP